METSNLMPEASLNGFSQHWLHDDYAHGPNAVEANREAPEETDPPAPQERDRRPCRVYSSGAPLACPLYKHDPLTYGGPRGCADWCTKQIHRLIVDHLKSHVRRGHISQDDLDMVKKQSPKDRSLSPQKRLEARWTAAYMLLTKTSNSQLVPSPYYERNDLRPISKPETSSTDSGIHMCATLSNQAFEIPAFASPGPMAALMENPDSSAGPSERETEASESVTNQSQTDRSSEEPFPFFEQRLLAPASPPEEQKADVLTLFTTLGSPVQSSTRSPAAKPALEPSSWRFPDSPNPTPPHATEDLPELAPAVISPPAFTDSAFDWLLKDDDLCLDLDDLKDQRLNGVAPWGKHYSAHQDKRAAPSAISPPSTASPASIQRSNAKPVTELCYAPTIKPEGRFEAQGSWEPTAVTSGYKSCAPKSPTREPPKKRPIPRGGKLDLSVASSSGGPLINVNDLALKDRLAQPVISREKASKMSVQRRPRVPNEALTSCGPPSKEREDLDLHQHSNADADEDQGPGRFEFDSRERKITSSAPSPPSTASSVSIKQRIAEPMTFDNSSSKWEPRRLPKAQGLWRRSKKTSSHESLPVEPMGSTNSPLGDKIDFALTASRSSKTASEEPSESSVLRRSEEQDGAVNGSSNPTPRAITASTAGPSDDITRDRTVEFAKIPPDLGRIIVERPRPLAWDHPASGCEHPYLGYTYSRMFMPQETPKGMPLEMRRGKPHGSTPRRRRAPGAPPPPPPLPPPRSDRGVAPIDPVDSLTAMLENIGVAAPEKSKETNSGKTDPDKPAEHLAEKLPAPATETS